jgi:hypothetical protein
MKIREAEDPEEPDESGVWSFCADGFDKSGRTTSSVRAIAMLTRRISVARLSRLTRLRCFAECPT